MLPNGRIFYVLGNVDEGWLVSFNVKVAVEPDSLTEPLTEETIKPADSSSVVDIATS